MSWKSYLYRWVKRADLYGTPINFKYKKRNTIQSFAGGVFTILSRIGILAFLFVLVANVIRKDKNVTFKSVNMSPINDKQVYEINLSNFDIAFGFQWSDGESHLYEKENLHKFVTLSFVY